MTDSRRLQRGVLAGCGLLFVLGVVGLIGNMYGPANFDTRASEVMYLFDPILLAAVAGFLVRRRPENPVGYLLALCALGVGVDSVAKAVLNLRLGGPTGWPMRWSIVVDNSSWILTFCGIALMLLLFPDGHLLSRRWRPLLVTTVAICGMIFLACFAAPYNETYRDVRTPVPDNPLASLPGAGMGVLFPLYGVCTVLAVGSLFIRAWRSRRSGDVRTAAQIRWLAWAAIFAIVDTAASAVIGHFVAGGLGVQLAAIVGQLSPYGLILAIAVAITRHGLYEIDRIVSRTVTYAVVSGLLLGVYVGIIAGLSALLPTNGNSLVVAAATLAVASLFIPVRRRVQGRVDRRFNRARHNRTVLVEQFAEQLRRDVTHGSGGGDLIDVVHRALEPAHASVWLVAR